MVACPPKFLRAPNPACPQRGPYEASEGIYPVMGKRKLGVGKGMVVITTYCWLLWDVVFKLKTRGIVF